MRQVTDQGVSEETCDARYKSMGKWMTALTLIAITAMCGLAGVAVAANNRSLVVEAKQSGLSHRLDSIEGRIESKLDKLLEKP